MKLNARNIALIVVAAWIAFWAVSEVIVKRQQKPVEAASELKITDTKVGTGQAAKPNDTLVVQYTAYGADGNKIESSRDKGEPHEFVLGRGEAIQGWEKGLVGMKVGGQRQLIVPPALGYPDGTPDGTIKPGATLKFDIELVRIK